MYLSSHVVNLVSFLFLFPPTSTPIFMEQPSIRDLSAPRSKFLELSGYEFLSYLIAMVQGLFFSGLDSESPYYHMQEFKQVSVCITIVDMSHDTLKWTLFPFSLTREAKQWYTCIVEGMNGSWDRLVDKFCLSFFPQFRVISLRMDILSSIE